VLEFNKEIGFSFRYHNFDSSSPWGTHWLKFNGTGVFSIWNVLADREEEMITEFWNYNPFKYY
jgi:hypothetical protein